MSAIAVAKKDFKGARRARTLWLVAALLAVVGGLMAYVWNQGTDQTSAEAVRELLQTVAVIMSFLLPIVVLVASYLAIAGERESGGIKFLLGLPNTRRDVLFGKFISRTLIATLSVVFMFVVTLAVALVQFGAFPVAVFLGVLAVTALYATVFVSIAVALSAFVKSRSRAVAGAIGAYFGLIIINLGIPVISIQSILEYLHQDLLGMEANPDLYNFVLHLSPLYAFQKIQNLVLPKELWTFPFGDSASNSREVSTGFGGGEVVAPEGLPIYLTDEFSVVIFAFWLVVPLTVAYWKFNRADLS